MKHKDTTETRFYNYIFYSPDGCWYWTGDKITQGYGRIWHTELKKNVLSHRFSYQLHLGQIPEGLSVCHSCDNVLCVNPNHLWLGTCADNNADKIKKGRLRYGLDPKRIRLSTEHILHIRSTKGAVRASDLAKIYGVTENHIYDVRNRKCWKQI